MAIRIATTLSNEKIVQWGRMGEGHTVKEVGLLNVTSAPGANCKAPAISITDPAPVMCCRAPASTRSVRFVNVSGAVMVVVPLPNTKSCSPSVLCPHPLAVGWVVLAQPKSPQPPL
jgi:hypothetical protein